MPAVAGDEQASVAAVAPAAIREGPGPRTLTILIVGVLALAAVLLVVATDRIQTALLERDAIAKGLHWTNGLLTALDSVDAVFGGGQLSDRDRNTIDLAFRLGGLKDYVIFDEAGKVVASSDPTELGRVNISSYWASQLLRGSPHAAIDFTPATDTAAASVLAETYLPVFRGAGSDRRVVGAFEAYLDVSTSAESYRRIGLYVSVVGVALIAAAGGVAVAFVRRTMAFRIERERMLATARHAAEASNAAKSRFLATVSHEIRTPMNGVLGTAELLAGTGLDAGQRDMVAVIRRSGAALLDLLNQLLDQSKIEAGKLEIAPAPFATEELVAGVAELMRPAAHAKSLELSVVLAPDVPSVVLGDATRVRQILLNLVGNAVKFTERGGITLSAKPDAGAPGGIAFRVEDTGIGIEPKALERLFQPFEQADASTTRRFGGTGLGLSIARDLAMLMGGSLTVDSTPGVGSAFTLVLPLPATAEPLPTQQATASADGPESAGLDLDVLVADDDPTNRWVIGRQLERLGCRAELVEDGAAALSAWRADPGRWQVLVTDWHMPGLDGLGLLGALRADPVFAAHRPLVAMMTASGLPEEVERARRAGADVVLVKPVPIDRLSVALAGVAPASGPSEPAGAPAVLDTTDLAALCGDDPDILRDALSRFADRLADGRAALAGDTAADRAAAAHSLRGAAAAVGGFALADACGRLEEAGGEGMAERSAVDYEIERLAAAVRARLAEPGETA